MKKHIISMILVVAGLTMLRAQGPVVYLPLEDNLNDASGNNLHAVDKGSVNTAFVNDLERGKVASFASAAHAQLPIDAKLAFVGTQSFSIGLWIKIDPSQVLGAGMAPAIISNKDWNGGSNAGFIIGLDQPDVVGAHLWTVNVGDGPGGGTRLDWDADDNNAINIKDGRWHFIAVVFDRAAKLNVYVDGELKQSDPAQDSYDLAGLITGSLDAGNAITLMQDGTGLYADDFSALLDDVAIFNRVLTSQEIQNFFVNGFIPEEVLTFNATVYFPLNDDLKDASGNAFDAIDDGTEPAAFVTDPTRGKVASFADAAHAKLPLVPGLDFVNSNNFSLAFWINIPDGQTITSDPVIFSNKDWSAGRNKGFLVGLDGPDTGGSHLWTVNVGDGTNRLDWDADDNDAINIKDGAWHHVAVVFDRAAKMNVYVDGELRQSDPAQDSYDLAGLITGDMQSGNPIRLMQDGTGTYPKDFAAFLDDVMMWSKALSATQVAALYADQYKEPVVEEDPVLALEEERSNSIINTYPNPTKSKSIVQYQLNRENLVSISLIDIRGKEIRSLINERQVAGIHKIEVDASAMAPGLYLYLIRIGNRQYTNKLIVK